MYIKIKYIKQFLLISACIFFAGFNYFMYVKADDARGVSQTSCDTSIDSDCDGLTNTEEKLYGTDATNADSDGDGYSDGVEVKSGYDPSIPAPGDKITNPNNSTATQDNTSTESGSSITNDFAQKLNDFIASKGDQQISAADVKDFTDSQLTSAMGDPITFDNLPQIDSSKIKILPQPYSTLSEADRKTKEKADAEAYLKQIAYIFVSNAPTAIISKDDAGSFYQDFLAKLSDPNSNREYFSDLGNRLGLFFEQASNIEVPETMIDLHIKFLRLISGILTMQNMPAVDPNDPMAGMITLSKANEFTNLTTSFLANDLAEYLKQLN